MRIPVLLAVAGFLGGAVSAAPAGDAGAASTPVAASVPATNAADPAVALKARLQEKFPGTRVQEIGPSPLPGIYEFTADGDVMYISADGKYLLDAQIVDIDKRENITEAKRAAERKRAFAALDEKQMIVFAPASYKYTITVFTDVDCGYCRKLHSEMAQINKLGVRVRYLAFPREGPGSEAWTKMEAVWCAKDRRTALTHAKSGQGFETEKTCKNAPIRSQWELGERMGVKGTPAVFTDTGKQIGGYVPVNRLLEALKTQS